MGNAEPPAEAVAEKPLMAASEVAATECGRAKARAAKQITITVCMASIHQRLVRTTSTMGLHRGLITQGRYSSDVSAASEALSMPRRLNMVTETTLTRK